MTSQPNANLVIYVVRNEHAPTFQQESYTVRIDRNQADNVVIARVHATDQDTVVCLFQILRLIIDVSLALLNLSITC